MRETTSKRARLTRAFDNPATPLRASGGEEW
jgi:hypothetical protein